MHYTEHFESLSIESDVDVSQVVNEFDQVGDNCVQSIAIHFLPDIVRQRSSCCTDPLVKHIGRLRQIHLHLHIGEISEREAGRTLKGLNVV